MRVESIGRVGGGLGRWRGPDTGRTATFPSEGSAPLSATGALAGGTTQPSAS